MGHRLARKSPPLPQPTAQLLQWGPLTLLPWQPACSWSREADRLFSRDTPIPTHAQALGDTGTWRPGQDRQRYGEPDGFQREKGSGGPGGRRKRDRCREEEIKTRGTERRREGAMGRRKAVETAGTGRQAERGGRRVAERWKQRAEGPQGTESRGPPRGLAQEGSKQGEATDQRAPRPPLSAVGIQVYTSSICCPGTAPGSRSRTATCQPHTAWLCSRATLVLGLTLRGTDTGPVSPWHLVSLPPAHTPPVQPPCLPAAT